MYNPSSKSFKFLINLFFLIAQNPSKPTSSLAVSTDSHRLESHSHMRFHMAEHLDILKFTFFSPFLSWVFFLQHVLFPQSSHLLQKPRFEIKITQLHVYRKQPINIMKTRRGFSHKKVSLCFFLVLLLPLPTLDFLFIVKCINIT